MGPPLRRVEGSVSLWRRYVCCTVVSARVHPHCHGVQVATDSVRPLSLHYTRYLSYKIYRRLLSMLACAAGYALTSAIIPKLQLVSLTVVGQTAANCKPLIIPMYGFESYSFQTLIYYFFKNHFNIVAWRLGAVV
jgi:hypothetical protein